MVFHYVTYFVLSDSDRVLVLRAAEWNLTSEHSRVGSPLRFYAKLWVKMCNPAPSATYLLRKTLMHFSCVYFSPLRASAVVNHAPLAYY